jgi:hypothetical protein
MTGETFTVTRDFIQRGANGPAGWNRDQMEILGVPWPRPKGWKRRAVGKIISVGDAEKFLALRGQSWKARRRERDGAGRPRRFPWAEERLRALADAVDHYLGVMGVGDDYKKALREAMAEATAGLPNRH